MVVGFVELAAGAVAMFRLPEQKSNDRDRKDDNAVAAIFAVRTVCDDACTRYLVTSCGGLSGTRRFCLCRLDLAPRAPRIGDSSRVGVALQALQVAAHFRGVLVAQLSDLFPAPCR